MKGAGHTGLYYTARHGDHSGYHSARSDVALDLEAQRAANHRAELVLVVVGLALIISVTLALYG